MTRLENQACEALHSVELLKLEFKQLKDSKDADTCLRLHRCLSWLDAAQTYQDDEDMCFINLWIAFKALVKTNAPSLDFQGFSDFLFRIDPHADLYDLCWHEYNTVIRKLIKNPFLYEGFWLEQTADESNKKGWKLDFEKESVAALNALSRRNEKVILNIVLSRLFVLQQQVLDGGATWKSQVNRQQISDGTSILQVLLPRIIRLMLSTDEVWGKAAYPVMTAAMD